MMSTIFKPYVTRDHKNVTLVGWTSFVNDPLNVYAAWNVVNLIPWKNESIIDKKSIQKFFKMSETVKFMLHIHEA